jgi:uncharacterized protein (DUF1697 family)
MAKPRVEKHIAYVAFLRGINVGGNKILKMEDLRAAFTSLGFRSVSTLLASGNVLFESPPADEAELTRKIEAGLKKKFGRDIGVVLREIAELRRLAETDPFRGIKVTPQTRLYVTFLSEKAKSRLKIPYESPEKDLKILRATDREATSVLTLSPGRGTPELMGALEKEFGRNITTRNWNTIVRILEG